MSPQLVELALRKQRLQIRSAEHREGLARHSQIFTPAFRGVDRVINGVHWVREHLPVIGGVSAFLIITRPRATLRWARRAWLGVQFVRRLRNHLAQ